MAVWTSKELSKIHDVVKLNKLYRSHCIQNGVDVPKKQVTMVFARKELRDKEKETYEQACQVDLQHQKDKDVAKLKAKKEAGIFDNGRSKYSIEAKRLKSRLTRDTKKTYFISHDDPAELQRLLLKQFRSAIDFHKKKFNWEKLDRRFIDADKLRAFDNLNIFQFDKFFEYMQLFFNMVRKRGTDCLWNPEVYCCASVPDWQDRLVFITGVEEEVFSDEESDEDSDDDQLTPCLYRSAVKKRAVHRSHKVTLKMGIAKSNRSQIYCSLISPHNEGGEEIYGHDYEAAHFACNNGRCLNPNHIKRQTIQENQNEGRRH
ncbi:hypothetical protein M3Y97_00821100 [Aphelenchoides bicaudatus]|nr:hypothetical protein M3Y97_00821100 [Aphelenchoides bicaudatus]